MKNLLNELQEIKKLLQIIVSNQEQSKEVEQNSLNKINELPFEF